MIIFELKIESVPENPNSQKQDSCFSWDEPIQFIEIFNWKLSRKFSHQD